MQTAVLKNLLPNSKVKLSDNNLVLLLSIFYNHPRLLNEDGWKLLKVGSENILIDTDTAYITKDKEIELIWNQDHITHIKLTSNLKGDDLKEHWEQMLNYAGNVQRDMNVHFDKDKVDELCDSIHNITLSNKNAGSDCENHHEHDKILPKVKQSPPTNTS